MVGRPSNPTSPNANCPEISIEPMSVSVLHVVVAQHFWPSVMLHSVRDIHSLPRWNRFGGVDRIASQGKDTAVEKALTYP